MKSIEFEPMRVTASEIIAFDRFSGMSLICPVCGEENSHIQRVFTRIGSDVNEAGIYSGTLAGGSTPYRRSSLVIEIDGECEHRWGLVIQQHKGCNYLQVERLPDAAYPDLENQKEDQ